MGIADYHPLVGPVREAMGTATDSEALAEGGGEASAGGGEGSFIDAETGQEIDGAYYACGACDYRPLREGDASCPQCGDVPDWNNIDNSGAP